MISQNGKTTLERLSACDKYLRRGERMVLLRFAVCVVIPVIMSVARVWLFVSIFYCNVLIIYCAAASIAWKIMETYISHKRKSAARMMQLAEGELFDIRWNKYLCGDEILPEDVFFSQGSDLERYKNRFPESLMNLPTTDSFLKCTGYNIFRYNSRQAIHDRLCKWVGGAAIAVVIAAAALVPSVNLNGFLFYAILACAPIVVWLSGIVDSTKRGKAQLQMIAAMVSDSEQDLSKGNWIDVIQDNLFLYRVNANLAPRGFVKENY